MAKKPKKKTIGVQSWKMYSVEGDSIRVKNKECPKCGPSYYMAEHNNRRNCGKCGYTEFKNKE